MSSDERILLNYTSVGKAAYGGMFALAGGFKATITARLGGVPLTVKGFALGEGKLYEWGLAMRRLAEDEIPQGVYTYEKDPAFVKATGGYGTIPALLSADGSARCCESNAIARAVARASRARPMYGATPWEQAQIDMFLDSSVPRLGAHLAKLWAMPEFAADLGDAVKALTEEYASRRGNVERAR